MPILYPVMKAEHKALPLKYKSKVIAFEGWICGAEFVLYLNPMDRAPMKSSDHAPFCPEGHLSHKAAACVPIPRNVNKNKDLELKTKRNRMGSLC